MFPERNTLNSVMIFSTWKVWGKNAYKNNGIVWLLCCSDSLEEAANQRMETKCEGHSTIQWLTEVFITYSGRTWKDEDRTQDS